MKIITYDLQEYNFPEEIRKIFTGVRDLEIIHEHGLYDVFTRENDQSSSYHKKFYSSMDKSFLPLYRRFVNEVIRKEVGEPLVYQKVPTFRIHLPWNVAVGEFHKDSDYMHGTNEVNYWVPLTRTFGNNTMWLESSPGTRDYAPVVLEPGQLLVFDGVNLRHGNKINDTDITRISFDFRVIKASEYEDSDRKTINTKMPFKVGGYFERSES